MSKLEVHKVKSIIKDAMSKIVWMDDAQVASGHVWKMYGERAEIRIKISVLTS
jgi:Holliday junction resolvase RusA-like endonuclease